MNIPLGAGDSLHGLAGTASAITYTIFGGVKTPNGPRNAVLTQGQLAVADATLYLIPPDARVEITLIILANATALAVTGVKLGINGTSATAANQILPGITIPANGFVTMEGGEWQTHDISGNLLGTGTQAFDSVVPAVDTPLTVGTSGTSLVASRRDHVHQCPGGIASIVAATAGIQNVETQVVGATIPAALLKAGTILRIEAYGTITSTVDNNVTFNVRIGPTTLTGTIPAALTSKCGNSGTVTTAPFLMHIRVAIRTAGAGGTVYGAGGVISLSGTTTQAMVAVVSMLTPASVAVDTTVANVFELTCVTAAVTTTVTFQTAVVEVVKM